MWKFKSPYYGHVWEGRSYSLHVETASVESIIGLISPFLNEYFVDEGYDFLLSFSIYWTGVFQQETHSLVSWTYPVMSSGPHRSINYWGGGGGGFVWRGAAVGGGGGGGRFVSMWLPCGRVVQEEY